jgi:iron complex outermembrane recepter protein
MMKFIICIILFLQVPTVIAQTIKVVSQKNNLPLQFVLITSTNPETSALTDVKGETQFAPFEKSSSLLFRLTGFENVSLTIDSLRKLNFNVSMKEKNYTLGEVVVLGHNPNTQTINTVGKIDLLGFSSLRRSNDMFLDRTLNLVPGVKMELKSTTSQSRILIRGIGGKSSFGIRDVKVYYDGIPITDADGTTNLDDIDFTSLGKVEVIKGSSAGIYGSSIGGTINLFTKRARFQEKDLNEIVTLGSYGLLRSTFNFRAGTEKVNFFTNYSYQNYDGYRDHSHSLKQLVTFGGDFFVSEAQTLSFLVNYGYINDEYPGDVDSVDFTNNPETANPEYVNKNIGLDGKSFLLGVTNIYEITKTFENTTSVFLGNSFDVLPIESYYRKLNTNKAGARTLFSYDMNFDEASAAISFGGEIIRNFNIDKQYFISAQGEAGDIISDNELDVSQINLFLQGFVNFTSLTSLTISSGMSWSIYNVTDNLKFNDVDHSFSRTMGVYFTPGFLLRQTLSSEINFYAEVSTGFSAPTIPEISLPDGTVNSELNPEKSINYEIGSEVDLLESKIQLEISLFYLNLYNTFIPQTEQNGFTRYVNAGKSTNRGAELSISYKILEDREGLISLLRPFITYSYNNFKYEDYVLSGVDYSGLNVPGNSPGIFNAGLDINSSTGLYFYFTYNFTGPRYLNDSNKASIEAYSIIDAKIGFRKRLANVFTLQVYAGINNPTNEHYSPVVTVNQKALSSRGLPLYYNPGMLSNYYGALNLEYHF